MRFSRYFLAFASLLPLSGCTSSNLQNALGTLKNPYPVLSDPGNLASNPGQHRINPFIEANYRILLEATELTRNTRNLVEVGSDNMRRYLAAGFALSDIYCEGFFRDADESQRRRRFGRGATNDAGTAIATVLGLANAGESIVTGVAAGFGLADNLWRNYDDAFVVSANLSHVRNLVLAAQDNFRERTLGGRDTPALPADYGTAQSVIIRYANLCSTLGMQGLLNESANQQREQLNRDTAAQRTGQSPPAPDRQGRPSGQVETVPPLLQQLPSVATPAVTSNTPESN